jgi:SIR2-like domain
MADKKIDQFEWDMIIEAVKDRRCVPFLGAGVNVSSGDYEGLPLGGEVAQRLVERLLGQESLDLDQLVRIEPGPFGDRYDDLLRLSLQDLARVALHVQFRGDNANLIRLLRTILPDDDCQPSKLLHTLARLPLQLIVTTNYDRLMEKALEANGNPSPLIVTQPIHGFSPREHRDLQTQLTGNDSLILYKIHGSFVGDSNEVPPGGSPPVIISEEDYIEFLIIAGVRNVGIPRLISDKLVDSTLLFLGYGLEDWDFRTIYKALIERLPWREKRKSFAIQRNPSKFWEDFWASKQVKIYDVDLYEFADELERRYVKSLHTKRRS